MNKRIVHCALFIVHSYRIPRRYFNSASTMLTSDAVGTTPVIVKPAASRSVRYSAAVRSSPPGIVSMTNGTFTDWREGSRTLDGLAAYQPRSYTLTGFGEPVRLRGTAVSTSMFPMLRARPSQGRLCAANEDRPGDDQVAIIGEQLWTRQFGRRADIVGKPITLDDRQFTVVGVLPASFYFPDHESVLWTPMTINIAPQQPGQVFVMVFSAIGRLKDGVSVSQAEAEGTAASGRNQPPPPPGADSSTPLTPALVRLVPLQAEMVAGVRPALLVLTAAVGFVLLIAAANIANLLLTRGAGRQRELAVRTALGARLQMLAPQPMDGANLRTWYPWSFGRSERGQSLAAADRL